MHMIDMKNLRCTPSPNADDRQPPERTTSPVIDTVILHYTGMQTGEEALRRLCDPDSMVSAHFLIEENGTAHQLVAPEMRAWHAGVSYWRGRDGMNHSSIGIELVNPGHEFGYRPFPSVQIDRLLELLSILKTLFHIPKHRYLGHSDVAPDRKHDPGELFPWRQLAACGFGVWADCPRNDKTILAKKGMVGMENASLNKSLRNIGYSVPVSEEFSQATLDALVAFQRHWRPEDVNGCLDRGTKNALEDIEKQIDMHEKLMMQISGDDR